MGIARLGPPCLFLPQIEASAYTRSCMGSLSSLKPASLKWPRVSMSYDRFIDLREIFQGDLSRNYQLVQCPRILSCHTATEGLVEEHLSVAMTMFAGDQVCKNKCKNTGKAHLMNSQPKFKARTQQHFWEVRRLVQFWEKYQSLCIPISWISPNSRCPTERHHLQHHLAMQPHQCSQQVFNKKLHLVCQRKKELQF